MNFVRLFPALLSASLSWSQTCLEHPIYQALIQESQRAVDSLRAPNGQKPYLIRFILTQYIKTNWVASLGQIESKAKDTLYDFSVDLRVGNRQLDQSQFPSYNVSELPNTIPFPVSGDPLLARKHLWSVLDRDFRYALEILPQKQAWLKEHPEIKPPPSWPKLDSIRLFEDHSFPFTDSSLIPPLLKSLSMHLDPQAQLLDSRVEFQHIKSTLWYYDTDNRKLCQNQSENTLVAAILDQAEDGSPLWDYLRFSSPKTKEILQHKITQSADSLYHRMQLIKKAVATPYYRGPVVFEDGGASRFWQGVLLEPLSALTRSGDITQSPDPLVHLLGKKLLDQNLSILIQSRDTTWQGNTLYSGFKYDQEGVISEPQPLVYNGRLARLPTKLSPHLGDPKDSTLKGHQFWGQFLPGFLEIQAHNALDSVQLMQKVKDLAKDEGLDKILFIKKIYDRDALALLQHPLKSQAYEPPQMDLFDVQKNQWIPVRGLTFSDYTLKDLRHLQYFSQEKYLTDNQGVQHLLIPKRMVLDLDDLKPRAETPPLSLLP